MLLGRREIIIGLTFAAVIPGVSGAESDGRRNELKRLRQMIEGRDSRVKDARSQQETAIALRNHVHRNISFKQTPASFAMINIDKAYSDSVAPEAGHYCQGLSFILISALEAFGIPARAVGMIDNTDEGRGQINTHASVDAFLGGRWISMDPTFNVTFFDGDRRFLSWPEALDLARQGKKLEWSTDGLGSNHYPRLETWPVPLKSYAQNVFVYPHSAQDKILQPMKILTPGWDGLIRYKSGLTYDVVASAGYWFYGELGAGLLR